MNIKKTLVLLTTFSLSGCFSTFFISDEEAVKIGREEYMTQQCLKYSHIQELRNITSLPDVGLGGQLKSFAYETLGSTVFGSERFNYIRRDWLFHKSSENKQDIINKTRKSMIAKPSKADCKLYLDLYENAYYRFKAQGY